MSNSVLKRLAQERVVRFEYNGAKDLFDVVECCDEWFGLSLTREELLTLAEEIKELSKTGVDK